LRIRIIAVGPLRASPERSLVDDYISRARRLSRQAGIRDLVESDVPAGGGREAESARLLAKCGTRGRIVGLDESGEALASSVLASRVSAWRDQGVPELCFLIGGAQGHGAAVSGAACLKLAFGPQTWPHRLARVMLAEQVYRTSAILSGSPYHKE